MPFSNDWTSSQLAEFVAVLSATSSVEDALEAAAERAAEALEAEVAAVIGSEEVLASVGFRAGTEPQGALLDVSRGGRAEVDVPGVGTCVTLSAPLDDPEVVMLLVGRSGEHDYSYQEATLLRGMGRVLVLTLRLLRTIEEERSVRAELQERQASLERLARIQTSISRRAPLQEVLDSITDGARELMRAGTAVIRLAEPDDPTKLRLVSASGMSEELRRAHEVVNVSEGVSGRTVAQDRLVVMNDYARNPGSLPSFAAAEMTAVMGAPIHEDNKVVGSLVVASYDPLRVYRKVDQELLMALAEHASVAITDAKTVEAKQVVEQQLAQAQKMEAIGNLAGGIAHDFNNLLFVIQSSAQFLSESIYPEDPRRQDVEEIIDAAGRAATLTRQLLAFSRKEIIKPEVLDVNLVVSEMKKLLSRTITHNIELRTHLDATQAWTRIDPGQLEQVLMNLAVNGKDAMPRGGCLTISTHNASVDQAAASTRPGFRPGEYVVIEVADTGTGMTEEVMRHAFEPFYTTKSLGQGTGLGLATVYGIVKRVEGYIDVASSPGEGTVFSVYLPLSAEEATEQESEVVEGPSGGSETILIAEDEPGVRNVVARQLRRAGYEVLEASSGEEAIALFDAHDRPIGLLLTDVIMPMMSGNELAAELLEREPDLKVIYMSGYTDEVIAREGVLGDDELFLQKPFSGRDLLEKVQQVLV